uniref:Neurobeachin n=1 Tax=Acrobeloides nanus TaxID=290746 RepID=A0A914C7G9_9BILA
MRKNDSVKKIKQVTRLVAIIGTERSHFVANKVMSNVSEEPDKATNEEEKDRSETQTPTKSPSPQLATIRASEERDSVSSDMLSIKSPDIDERELEDVQLNDNYVETVSVPSERFNFSNAPDQRQPSPVQHDESTDEEPVKKDDEKKHKEKAPDEGSLSSQIENATVIHASDETAEETFSRLKKGILARSLSQKDIVDGLFNVLVGGPFDLDSRFIIENSENIEKMLDLIDAAPPSLKAEIWSVFVAIVRKSFRNLEACSRVGLISKCLERLPQTDAVISDLLIQLLSVLTSYSITVKETKHFLRALRASNGIWHRNSAKLLNVMQEMPKRDGADVFFSFPGKASAGIALPPISKWPYQNGWTFSTWLRMDPLNSVNFEKEKPYLFSFSTNKGVGYHCYFMGSCLVLHVTKGPGKETMKCIKQELVSRKWHHVAISYVYSRWARSEIQCFIDGQLAETIDMTWLVNTNDYFDRCYIGCGSDPDPNQAFCGQMGAVYVFAQSISLQQANCLYCLGAGYQSYFKHDAESNLPEGYKKHLFDGHLNSSLVFAYCPKNCHGQLCLFPTPKTATMYFVQVPHAIMKEGVEVITTHSIHNSLHSVGGIQMLLPLFAQIDMPHQDREPPVDYAICSKLLSVISLLLSTSPSAQQQLFHSQGFLIIANVLNTSSKGHLTLQVLEALINMSKFLLTCPAGIPLLKQLFDHLFFNPQLWIRTEASIQIRLYSFLANDFFANASFLSIVRRTSTVIELMHTLKTYYWLAPPKTSTTLATNDPPPDRNSIVQIRSHILHLVNKLMFLLPSAVDEKDVNRDEEFQCIFNFIGTVSEDDNLYDVLTQTMHQLCDHPAVMVPAFDRKKGVAVIFKLLSSPNELIRLPALKIFGYFICRSTLKRKNESINNLNLLSLLADRLLMNNRYLSLATYNALFEILTEYMTPEIQFIQHEDLPADTVRFENPTLLKVIANLITQSENTEELMKVKKIFLEDMIRLCKDSKENRRIILQMSVWQEWLISLAYILPENREEEEITELVFEIFAILLYHAIRLEYGGWRVWVDTLAIAHSKVSWERYRRSIRRAKTTKIESEETKAVADAVDEVVSNTEGESLGSNEKSPESIKSQKSIASSQAAEDVPSSLYRTPEFVWSRVHIRLLNDLLLSIENIAEEWNDPNSSTALMDHVNNNDNQIFISNTVHVLSQLTDSLIMACGGLLPLLAAATSPNSELEITDTTQQELSIEDAVQFLRRFANLSDVFIFASGISFSELEQEKNMPNGGILRQALRLVSTMAVRNILACRVALKERGFSENTVKQRTKFNAIMKFVQSALELKDTTKGISDVNRLLQEIDLQRLKGVVYRDMEEGRQAQFLALSVVYLLSVLMVSRYRDILEPPTSPSPFFDTNSDSSANRKSVDSPKDTTKGSPSTSITNGNGSPTSPPHTQVSYLPKSEYSENGGKEESQGQEESQDVGDEENEDEEEQKPKAISSIPYNSSTTELEAKDKYNTDQLNRFNTAEEIKSIDASERRKYLTDKLQKALEPVAPLLREIMSDFKSFLQKTLLGTHGQEIMNDVKVMQTLKNQQGSVIELVMLLCSQEWQTSLQKHAGLAFIELVNEGRLMAHATRDHVLRVANEADFILNRLRAEDVSKHAQFDNESAEQLYVRKQDEQVSDHLIISSRRRDFLVAQKLLEKMRTILLSPSGAWCSNDDEQQTFWKLDLWEDDSRRRKRFVPNAYGCKHSMASIKKVLDEKETEELEKAREELLKELTHKMIISTGQPKTSQVLNELVDESDIEKWASEENDLRDTRQEHASYSTQGKLIAPGIVVHGTISITATDLYFDTDEDHPLNKQLDPKVG